MHFDINYLDNYLTEKSQPNENIFGIAKHICGCGLDLSLKCLLNHKKLEKIKGLCLATCCHHKCDLNILVNLDFYLNYLKLNLKEITMIIKATSWIFGPIDVNSKTDFTCKIIIVK